MKRKFTIIAGCALIAVLTRADPTTNQTSVVGTNVVVRIGFLAEDVMQHPIIAEPSLGSEEQKQFNFDVGQKSDSMRQIIVVYPSKMKIPTEKGRKIELKGTADHISFKGGKGGKTGYENEVFNLQLWKYLEDKPSQPTPGN
jgi:hypothetical protein